MIDIKRLLHKYLKMKQARKNADITKRTLEQRERSYRADENWFIRGTTVSNRLESMFIHEEDTIGKIYFLQTVIDKLDPILEAVESARTTLEDEQKDLIDLRYFEGRKVASVCLHMTNDKREFTEGMYNYTHRIAMEDMTVCLNPILQTMSEEELDRIIFGTYGTMLDEGRKVRVNS